MDNASVILIDPLERSVEALAGELQPFGYSLIPLSDIDDLDAAIGHHDPSHVLVRFHGDRNNTDLRDKLGASGFGRDTLPPLAIVADDPSVKARIEAVRLGADAYLVAPVNGISLVDRLDAVKRDTREEPYRVMVIDDDERMASYYEVVLSGAGMRVLTVNDPMQVMRHLADFRPELILLDHYMPDIQGRELAAVIRQEAAFDSIPIVFLSAEDDMSTQQELMRIGGDDFLTKPIKPAHLVSAVTTRARRFRALRSTMMRDSLTGLLNHTAIKEQLSVDIARMRRSGRPLSFAIIDLDRFKRVNDTYGHPTGDRVLKAVAHLIKQRLRASDVVGRYGGEEFAVVLPETPLADAQRVLDEIRAAFAGMTHRHDGGTFRVTLSCGVASFPDYDTPAALTDAADKAMYEAKTGGRNRTVCAPQISAAAE